MPTLWRAIRVHPAFGRAIPTARSCIACNLCEAICPRSAPSLTRGHGAMTARVVPRATTSIDMTKCIYCGLCQEPCPLHAFVMGPQPKLASDDSHGTAELWL